MIFPTTLLSKSDVRFILYSFMLCCIFILYSFMLCCIDYLQLWCSESNFSGKILSDSGVFKNAVW